MKVYISADIEGVTDVTNWDETELYHDAHEAARIQMTREVAAACRGAIAAGATEIYVKDAHDSARNLVAEMLPEEAILIRGWTYSPGSMVAGVDETFDAMIYIGYHSGASYNGNPLAHTMNTQNNYIRVNGENVSEFHMNSYMAAHYGVPAVFLSGDAQMCDKAKQLIPSIETVAVKHCIGNATFNINPAKACRQIEQGVETALKKLTECRISVDQSCDPKSYDPKSYDPKSYSPESYEVEINFKEATPAYRASFFPGVTQVDSKTVKFTAENAYEMMRTCMFIW